MRFQTIYTVAALSTVLLISACNQNGANNTQANLDTEIDSVSYALGYQNGKFLAQQGVDDLNSNAFSAGLNTGLENEEGQFEEMEAQQVIQTYIQNLTTKKSEENLEKGEAFLAEKREEDGVEETESGLQYKVIEEGSGESPSASDVVRVHYEGHLIDGTYFDTSIKEVAEEHDLYTPQREPYDPAQFRLSGVIPGWTEGLQLMSEGAIYEFCIPANLAYGENPPQGSPIGPNETLIFKVELIEVNPSE